MCIVTHCYSRYWYDYGNEISTFSFFGDNRHPNINKY